MKSWFWYFINWEMPNGMITFFFDKEENVFHHDDYEVLCEDVIMWARLPKNI